MYEVEYKKNNDRKIIYRKIIFRNKLFLNIQCILKELDVCLSFFRTLIPIVIKREV